MKIVVEVNTSRATAGDAVAARVLLINDSTQRITVDKRLLVGPNMVAAAPVSMAPPPVAVEPVYDGDDDRAAQILLAPGAIYGRERTYRVSTGTTLFHGYLLRSLTHALLPGGPAERDLAAAIADPVAVIVD
jgi:hypothetical protein